MKPARVGFIGCGRFATTAIYPALRFAPLDLIAVCSRQAAKAELTARTFGARRWYTDYAEMLTREELDGVFCITGGNQHLTTRYSSSVTFRKYGISPSASAVEGNRK